MELRHRYAKVADQDWHLYRLTLECLETVDTDRLGMTSETAKIWAEERAREQLFQYLYGDIDKTLSRLASLILGVKGDPELWMALDEVQDCLKAHRKCVLNEKITESAQQRNS